MKEGEMLMKTSDTGKQFEMCTHDHNQLSWLMGRICFPLTSLHVSPSRRPQIKEVSAQAPRILMLERQMCGAQSETAAQIEFI